jgi:hypothetical protein
MAVPAHMASDKATPFDKKSICIRMAAPPVQLA